MHIIIIYPLAPSICSEGRSISNIEFMLCLCCFWSSTNTKYTLLPQNKQKKKTNTRAVHVCHWPVLQFSNGGFKLHHSELGKIFALLLHKQDEGQSGVGCITCRTMSSWYRTHTVTIWQHWLALCLSFLMAYWRSTRQSETHATFYANQLFFPTKQLLGATKRKDLFLAHWTLKSISKNWYWFVWP